MMAETERAVFEIHINGSIDAVWHQITKTDEPQECFFNMWMETTGLAPGAPIRMQTKSRKYTGAVGKVLEFDPPRRYAHTFRLTNLDDPECTVIYDLEEVDDGVKFKLTLENLTPGTKSAKQMTQGGNMIVKTLKRMVENGKPSLGIRLLYVLFRILEPLSGKKMRSENWPLETRE